MTMMRVLVFCPNCGRHLGYCMGKQGEVIYAKDFVPAPGYKGERPKDNGYSYCDICKTEATFDGTKTSILKVREGSKYGKEEGNGK